MTAAVWLTLKSRNGILVLPNGSARLRLDACVRTFVALRGAIESKSAIQGVRTAIPLSFWEAGQVRESPWSLSVLLNALVHLLVRTVLRAQSYDHSPLSHVGRPGRRKRRKTSPLHPTLR